jgi:hypothetical protein
MAAPTSYTETSLKIYMHTALGAVATALGWTVQDGNYDELVNETLLVYGTDDVTGISGQDNIRKLRTLARVEAWRAVVRETAGDYDFSADGGSYKRSQIHAQAKMALEAAQDEAALYDDSYRVVIDQVKHVHDPYAYFPDEERTVP